jgi:UPF0755 protein
MAPRSRPIRTILLAIALIATTGAIVIYDHFRRPGPAAVETTVIVPKGAGVATIADLLDDIGVVASPYVFRLWVRLTRAEDALRAGEYLFPARVSLRDVIAMLVQGRVRIRRLTIPEGLTSAQIVALVHAAEGLEGEIETVPAEGTLLPETYYYNSGDRRAGLVDRMAAAMRAAVDRSWAARSPGLPLASPEEAIVLASIVEKETAIPAERPRVAAVFLNRLRLGMRLQADPTVIYAMSAGEALLERPLAQADLAFPSPYNTYQSDGLPPGPIANPGQASLGAVLNPAPSEELFFVADGSGGHVFARSLEEHNRNVVRWRSLKKRTGGD